MAALSIGLVTGLGILVIAWLGPHPVTIKIGGALCVAGECR